MKRLVKISIVAIAIIFLVPGLTLATFIANPASQGYTGYDMYMVGSPGVLGATVWAKQVSDNGGYKYYYIVERKGGFGGEDILFFDLAMHGVMPVDLSAPLQVPTFGVHYGADNLVGSSIFDTTQSTYLNLPGAPGSPNLHLVFNPTISDMSEVFWAASPYLGAINPLLLKDTFLSASGSVLTASAGGSIQPGTGVPEPATLLLIGGGLLGLAVTRSLRSRKR